MLLEYEWQINQRGVANIIPRSGSSVHGLVYMLGDGDEEKLDRSEGVSRGAYTKTYLPVAMCSSPPTSKYLTREIVSAGGPEVLELDTQERMSRGGPYFEHNVLVYVSEDYVKRGWPREEYIDRMNSGIRDATILGVPRDFIDRFLREFIPLKPPPRIADRRHRSASIPAARQRSPSEPPRNRDRSRYRPRDDDFTVTDSQQFLAPAINQSYSTSRRVSRPPLSPIYVYRN